jgi:hypothetical protein
MNGKRRDLMADADRHDPNGSHSEPDFDRYYRDRVETGQQENARTTSGVNIRDFYLDDRDEEEYRSSYDEPRHHDSVDEDPHWRQEGSEETGGEAHSPPAANAAVSASGADGAPADAPVEALAAEGEWVEPEAAPEEDVPAAPAKLAENPVVRFAAIGGLLGILFGAAMIGLAWLLGKPDGPYDLGTVTSNAVGLKGHLFTKWDDDELQYRLAFEPSDSSLHSAFAVAVSNPPRPLSIGIQLKDAMGFVVCTRDIVLKYEPAVAAAAAPAVPGAVKGGDGSSGTPAPPPMDAAQLAAGEKQREQGKDVFQPQNGADGQVAAINAQGVIPCSDKAYAKVVAWGFTPDFPSLTEQSTLLKQQSDKQSEEHNLAAHKRSTAKPPDKTLRFSIEGDDSIVGYDPSSGVLEGESGEDFFVEKEAGLTNLAAWRDFPIRIHYRCDQTSLCTLTRPESGTLLHARLRR